MSAATAVAVAVIREGIVALPDATHGLSFTAELACRWAGIHQDNISA